MKKLFVSVVALLAAVSLSAQDLTAIYNEAAAAYGAKDFAGAAAKFEQVIDQGMDNEDAASLVATAKKTLPNCYFMLGGGALKGKNYDEALKNFTKSAELAELYGDMNQMAKANGWVAKMYQIQGGDAFNNKDYATAAGIFEKGYKADPDNTDMALNLAMSYCEMFMNTGDMAQYERGMEIYEAVAAKTHPKYAEAAAKAKEMITLYTNNMVAKLQEANNFDGIIAAADAMLAKNPASALAEKVRLQAYANKKDYAKVIELAQTAADAQTDPEDKSLMYYLLGAAYNAKEMKPQAIAAFQKVTAGPAAESAKAALAELSSSSRTNRRRHGGFRISGTRFFRARRGRWACVLGGAGGWGCVGLRWTLPGSGRAVPRWSRGAGTGGSAWAGFAVSEARGRGGRFSVPRALRGLCSGGRFPGMRASPLRVSGVRPQRASNAVSSIPSHAAASIASGSNTGSNAALRCRGARRFQGQQLWQQSQPKIRSRRGRRRSPGPSRWCGTRCSARCRWSGPGRWPPWGRLRRTGGTCRSAPLRTACRRRRPRR